MNKTLEVFDRSNVGSLVLLELLSVSPVFMIFGNILPKVGLKIHYYLFGAAFLAAGYHLAHIANKKWIFYVFIFYAAIQPIYPVWDVKTLIDYFFGPFILLALSDIAFDQSFPSWLKQKYIRRFLYFLAIPLLICVLQFLRIVPFTFLEAQYVNRTLINGVYYPRANGFLYHGSELAVMIYFSGIMAIFSPPRKAYAILTGLILVAAMTLYKAIFATMVVLLLYYMIFVDREIFHKFQILKRKRLLAYLGVVLAIALFFFIRFTSIHLHYTGYLFRPEMLTGRGSIWNIYLDGIQNFNFWQYLFGSGMGSEFSIFEKYATPDNFYPLSQFPNYRFTMHTHNSFLSIFINSGFVGLAFIGFLFYSIIKQITWSFNSELRGKLIFAAFILPFLLIGITIPVFNKAIYWVMIGFIVIQWSESKYGVSE